MNAKMKRLSVILAILICSPLPGGEQIYRTDHAEATHENVPLEYAEAICRTATAARKVAVDQFGFDMPETIVISIRCGHREKVRLFNDGHDRFYLTIRSEDDLHKPSDSGIFHIYGVSY